MKLKSEQHVYEKIVECPVTIFRTKTRSLFTLHSRSFMVTNGWPVASKKDTSARKIYKKRKQQRDVQAASLLFINFGSCETVHITRPAPKSEARSRTQALAAERASTLPRDRMPRQTSFSHLTFTRFCVHISNLPTTHNSFGEARRPLTGFLSL